MTYLAAVLQEQLQDVQVLVLDGDGDGTPPQHVHTVDVQLAMAFFLQQLLHHVVITFITNTHTHTNTSLIELLIFYRVINNCITCSHKNAMQESRGYVSINKHIFKGEIFFPEPEFVFLYMVRKTSNSHLHNVTSGWKHNQHYVVVLAWRRCTVDRRWKKPWVSSVSF